MFFIKVIWPFIWEFAFGKKTFKEAITTNKVRVFLLIVIVALCLACNWLAKRDIVLGLDIQSCRADVKVLTAELTALKNANKAVPTTKQPKTDTVVVAPTAPPISPIPPEPKVEQPKAIINQTVKQPLNEPTKRRPNTTKPIEDDESLKGLIDAMKNTGAKQ